MQGTENNTELKKRIKSPTIHLRSMYKINVIDSDDQQFIIIMKLLKPAINHTYHLMKMLTLL